MVSIVDKQSGRQAALATRLLHKRGARAVQILDPRLPARLWDWVVAPAHDGLSGAHVIQVHGSLNEIDDAWLAEARAAFPALGALPGPRTAVLIGGPSAHLEFDVAALDALCTQLDALAAGGALMITASRRTPVAASNRDCLVSQSRSASAVATYSVGRIVPVAASYA